MVPSVLRSPTSVLFLRRPCWALPAPTPAAPTPCTGNPSNADALSDVEQELPRSLCTMGRCEEDINRALTLGDNQTISSFGAPGNKGMGCSKIGLTDIHDEQGPQLFTEPQSTQPMQAYGCCPKTSPCSWSVELPSPLPMRTAGAPDNVCSCVTTSLQALDLVTVLSLLPIFYVDHLEAPGTRHSDSLHLLLPWPYLAASLLLWLKSASC